MSKYKYQKITVNKDTPLEVLEGMKQRYIYDPEDGEIYNTVSNRIHNNIHKKGYLSELSFRFNNIEYLWKPSRYIWYLMTGELLESNVQIEHEDKIKTNNKWSNLRKATNQQNQFNKGLTKDKKYKGVVLTIDKKLSGNYKHFAASIGYNNKLYKIGRFRDEIKAAQYYDSAARFYFKEFASPNFSEIFIEPLDIISLRQLKIKNGD